MIGEVSEATVKPEATDSSEAQEPRGRPHKSADQEDGNHGYGGADLFAGSLLFVDIFGEPIELPEWQGEDEACGH